MSDDEMPPESYGYFDGGDPRSFLPDLEVCLRSEVEAWLKAVEDADAVEVGCLRIETSARWVNGTHFHVASFGMGTYRTDGTAWPKSVVRARMVEAWDRWPRSAR